MTMIKYLLFLTLVISKASTIFLSDASLNEVKATLLKSLSPFAQYPGAAGSIGGGPIPGIQGRGGCPLCDSSVYSYCSDRMIHDGCCCNAGNVPFRCPPDDCSYLNANSCYEHSLLFHCCCNNPYH